VPHGVVKTKQDEKDWSSAKQSCKTYHDGKEGGGARFYRCVMGTFSRIKSNRKRSK